MRKIYALSDKLDNSISSHFIGGEGVSDSAMLRAVRAQFKDHFAVKDLTLVSVAEIKDNGEVISSGVEIIGELFSNEDKIENA